MLCFCHETNRRNEQNRDFRPKVNVRKSIWWQKLLGKSEYYQNVKYPWKGYETVTTHPIIGKSVTHLFIALWRSLVTISSNISPSPLISLTIKDVLVNHLMKIQTKKTGNTVFDLFPGPQRAWYCFVFCRSLLWFVVPLNRRTHRFTGINSIWYQGKRQSISLHGLCVHQSWNKKNLITTCISRWQQ